MNIEFRIGNFGAESKEQRSDSAWFCNLPNSPFSIRYSLFGSSAFGLGLVGLDAPYIF